MSLSLEKPSLSKPDTTHKQAGRGGDPMLLACRDMALQILMQSFDGFFSRLEEIFFELAEKTHDRNLRDMYFAARAETQTKRSLIADEFKQRFIQAFNSRTQELTPEQKSSTFYKIETPPAELSLVANDEYEENISANRVAHALKQNGGDSLRQLEQRLAALLPFEMGEANSPISPEAICEALLGACRQLESGLDARLVAIKAFEDQLASSVADVYKHVNDFLIQHNIQPVTVSAATRVHSRGNGQPAGAQAAGAGAAEPGAVDANGMVSVSVPAALAQHFEMLASGRTMAASNFDHHSQINFLNQLQHRLPRGMLGEQADGRHPERDNLVSLLLNTQWAQKLPQMDGMTLNVVALMFDHMFEDPRLPEAIKGLIGRLQIPVLKVALLDNTFFSRKNHPARLLVDKMAEVALDGEGNFEVGTPGYDKLSEIVAWVVDHFEEDVSTFEKALADLQHYLAVEAEVVENKLSSEVAVLAAAELQELAHATTEAVLKGRTFQRPLPPLITDFLENWWSKALQAAYGAEGESTPQFVACVKALDDLLWSLEPKQGTEDRLKLVNLLPSMLKTLEVGAGDAGMSPEARQRFFSELVHCHAAAIRNGARPLQASTPAVPVTVAAPAPVVSVAPPAPALNVAEPDAAVNSAAVSAPLAADAMAIAAPADLASPVAQRIPQRGDWIELLDDEGVLHRLKLSWVSPQGTRYIFTNRVGENGRTFLRAELEKVLANGRMRLPVSVDNLTDQVLGQLRETLAS